MEIDEDGEEIELEDTGEGLGEDMGEDEGTVGDFEGCG